MWVAVMLDKKRAVLCLQPKTVATMTAERPGIPCFPSSNTINQKREQTQSPTPSHSVPSSKLHVGKPGASKF